jgi:hypothetical protein
VADDCTEVQVLQAAPNLMALILKSTLKTYCIYPSNLLYAQLHGNLMALILKSTLKTYFTYPSNLRYAQPHGTHSERYP